MAPLPVTFSDLLLFETFVSISHGGSRPRRCAGGVIRGIVNNIGGNRQWPPFRGYR